MNLWPTQITRWLIQTMRRPLQNHLRVMPKICTNLMQRWESRPKKITSTWPVLSLSHFWRWVWVLSLLTLFVIKRDRIELLRSMETMTTKKCQIQLKKKMRKTKFQKKKCMLSLKNNKRELYKLHHLQNKHQSKQLNSKELKINVLKLY